MTANTRDEALQGCVDEIERLRDAMFRVYACAANGGNVTREIERMRDVYEMPWSVDRARAALAPVAERQPVAETGEALSASEALFGFMGWLTCRDEAATFGAAHNAAPAAELVGQFMDANGLQKPREGWHKRLTHPASTTPTTPPAAAAGRAAVRDAVEVLRAALCNDEPRWRALCTVMAALPWLDSVKPAAARASTPEPSR